MDSGIEAHVSPLKCLLALSLLLTLACGGDPGNSNFTVEPQTPVVGVGEQVQIAAQPNVDLGGEMEWEVQEMYGGGLLRSQGASVTYVAPEAAGVYHLILRAPRQDGRALKQTVTVRVVGSSSLEPGNPRVAPGGAVSFTARIKGLSKGTVRWSVQEANGGSITEEGRYTAPDKPGTYHVTAVSSVDPSVAVQATVNVE